MLIKVLRTLVNVIVLFSALVLTPVLFLSHFSSGVAGMLGEFSDRFLPNSTVLAREKMAHSRYQEQHRAKRVEESKRRVRMSREVKNKRGAALSKGNKILVRGAAAMAIGWVPVLGVSADVYSLAEDYGDVCDLLNIIDDMSELLLVIDDSLYRENYCHKPDEGMLLVKEAAEDVEWPWEAENTK